MLLSILVDIPSKSLASTSLISKLAYYQRKYGIFHAVASYIGRYNQYIWKIFGFIITRRYLYTWLATSKFRLINLGGGSNCLEGCLTVDIDPRADAYVDITKKLPFDNASIDAIFCEEVIEHVNLQLGRNLLKECLRILKPGGIIRIATPNLNWFTEQSSSSLTACHNINNIFYEHGHRYLYTQEALEFYCQEIGFTNLKISTYKDNESRLGYLDSHAERFKHPPEMSQYLEAQKPVD